MRLQDVVSVRVLQSSPMASPVGQGTLGTWFPTADGFGVRFPDGDHFMRLDPPRRWKRGQKMNRGGRRRAREKHAAAMAPRDYLGEALERWERRMLSDTNKDGGQWLLMTASR